MIVFTHTIVQKGDEVQVVADYATTADLEAATEAELVYAVAVRAALTKAIHNMQPTDAVLGKTVEQAETRLDICRDIRKAGE